MNLKQLVKNFKIIFIHVFIGAGVFYFLVHPFTMVLYGFEFEHENFTWPLFWEVLQNHLSESFSFNMWGMGGLLTILGGILGFVFSIFWINIKEKRQLIYKQERLLKNEISALLKAGENERVEFKSSIRYDYHRKTTNRELEMVIAKTIVGFMNAKGGKLILGVDDDGKILGLENDFKTLKHKNRDGYEREIFQIISNYLGHKACFANHISFYDLKDKEICLVDVEASSDPVYVNNGPDTTFYVRTGNATYPLSVKETVDYLKTKKI